MRILKSKILKTIGSYLPLRSTLTSSSGFTIIELLVVLTLVGLVSGVGIFSLVNYGNTQTLQQAVGDIKSVIDEAKFNSVSSVVMESSESGNQVDCDNDQLVAYQVERSVGDFTLIMICEGGVENIVKTYSLHEDLSMGNSTTCGTIRFEAVDIHASGDPSLPCSIVVEGFGQTRVLTVDILGNVVVQSS